MKQLFTRIAHWYWANELRKVLKEKSGLDARLQRNIEAIKQACEFAINEQTHQRKVREAELNLALVHLQANRDKYRNGEKAVTPVTSNEVVMQ